MAGLRASEPVRQEENDEGAAAGPLVCEWTSDKFLIGVPGAKRALGVPSGVIRLLEAATDPVDVDDLVAAADSADRDADYLVGTPERDEVAAPSPPTARHRRSSRITRATRS
ncbi:hypothetical protein [Kibdelosporangium phytohabitans]|uniref:Uncharacterized protein n=1 Tax=Kibdelosporangium phytohabitans TaxID=860235 RepID=A0A0N7F3U8_9PSEU|nr:hypothetical protein [Kibdelosporangium phytohabitans]ALG09631.1 hypothetical protein AOZ06_24435 [Kibdelosporangium phytohabitans]MBE1469028.1 hypothetical protein [Kibdelosporangium phytohabitans]